MVWALLTFILLTIIVTTGLGFAIKRILGLKARVKALEKSLAAVQVAEDKKRSIEVEKENKKAVTDVASMLGNLGDN